MNSVQSILEGKTKETPQEAEVTLHYGPLMVLQKAEHRSLAQYIHVSPSVYGEGGSLLELFIDRGKSDYDFRISRVMSQSLTKKYADH